MVTTKQSTAPRSNRPKPRIDIPVERDTNFARITADTTVVVTRQRDVQITLLVRETVPTAFGQSAASKLPGASNSQKVELTNTITELGRVRLNPAAAFNMAMTIISDAVASGRLTDSFVRKAVIGMLDHHASESENSDAEDGEE